MHRLNALTPIPFDSDAILQLSFSSTLIQATVHAGMGDEEVSATTISVVVSGMESMPTLQTKLVKDVCVVKENKEKFPRRLLGG